jgi:hypothetical protein
MHPSVFSSGRVKSVKTAKATLAASETRSKAAASLMP